MAGFKFYDLVWWLERPTKQNLKDHTRRLARWLGVSHQAGSNMSYVNHDDYLQEDRRKEVEDFNCRIEVSLDNANFIDDEFDKNLHLRNINDDLNSGARRENDETTPNPVYGDMNTDGYRRRHYNIRRRRSGDMSTDDCRG
jgi:hypothetical protein